MDYNTPHLGSWPAKVVLKVSAKLRSRHAYSNETVAKANAKAAEERRRRQHPNQAKPSDNDDVNELGERDYSVFSEASTLVGDHHKDHTDMMHRLAHHDSFDSLIDLTTADLEKLRDPYFDSRGLALERRKTSVQHERMVAELPKEIWQRIASFLDEIDAASLATSTKILGEKLGNGPLEVLSRPENRALRISFIHSNFDTMLPNHLLCFHCGSYHKRINPGSEALKIDYVSSPVFRCPLVKSTVLPRTRLTHLRELPYQFVQLSLRQAAHGPGYGISPETLERQWKCRDSGWRHRTRYMVHDGHLLVRIVSQIFAPAQLTVTEQRHLLYDREEYVPFFSVCHHWRDGELTRICKCALSHIPKPPDSYISQLKRAPKISKTLAHPNFIVTMCDYCRPVRRCPECPSEYLVEVQMMEDKTDPVNKFKHAIVVTRWADLGDGSSPHTSPEWAAIHGKDAGDQHEVYESFSHVGRRAVSGVFESRISGSIPGQRMLSLNPKKEKKGEEGNGWY